MCEQLGDDIILIMKTKQELQFHDDLSGIHELKCKTRNKVYVGQSGRAIGVKKKGLQLYAVQRTAPQVSQRTPATCISATTPGLIFRNLNSVFFK